MLRHVLLVLDSDLEEDAPIIKRQYPSVEIATLESLTSLFDPARPIETLTINFHSDTPDDPSNITMSDGQRPDEFAITLHKTGILDQVRKINLLSCSSGLLYRYRLKERWHYSAYFAETFAKTLYDLDHPNVVINSLTNVLPDSAVEDNTSHAAMMVFLLYKNIDSPAVEVTLNIVAFGSLKIRAEFDEAFLANKKRSDILFAEYDDKRAQIREIDDNIYSAQDELGDAQQSICCGLGRNIDNEDRLNHVLADLNEDLRTAEIELEDIKDRIKPLETNEDSIIQRYTVLSSKEIFSLFDSYAQFRFYPSMEAEAYQVLGEKIIDLMREQALDIFQFEDSIIQGFSNRTYLAERTDSFSARLEATLEDLQPQSYLYFLKKSILTKVNELLIRCKASATAQVSADAADDNEINETNETEQQLEALHSSMAFEFGSAWIDTIQALRKARDPDPLLKELIVTMDQEIEHYHLGDVIESERYQQGASASAMVRRP